MKSDNVIIWLGALAVCALLSTSHLLDDDNESLTGTLADSIQAARTDARKEAAARAMCTELHGPYSFPQWDADGALSCLTHRGKVIAVSSTSQN